MVRRPEEGPVEGYPEIQGAVGASIDGVRLTREEHRRDAS